uniref:NADH dehydrogenase subunit 4 n=1 Tax=Charcotia amundseni TaxID=2259499 RepID=UPI001FF34BA1|nr:NADH dehydrogenase subunit 4 [Charcotia amundseni]UIN24686.1 NADH dehydrogenase subunit 4 [Charcotia amundseni]
MLMNSGLGLLMKSLSEVCLVGLVMVFLVVLSSSDLSLFWVSEIFEVDMLSKCLILLSVWVSLMCMFGTNKISFGFKISFFFFMMLMLLFFLFLSFSVNSYLMFYVSFESCLIPILFMILGWGFQPERSMAGVYMLFYTLFGSFPLFYSIVSFGCSFGGGYMMSSMSQGLYLGWGFSLMFISAFMIKFPMYSVHLWLLKAHVEAPVAGSMILAGVLLKLGGYGLIRVFPLIYENCNMLSEAIISIGLWGSFMVSLGCLRQMDMKLLIASSSVVHMGTCISGLFILSEIGYKGGVVMMIAHGVCSSGLFYMANMVYERSGSRSMHINKGLLNLMPVMSLCWFLLIGLNMASPPSVNLMSEIMLIVGLVSWSSVIVVVLVLVCFFSASYGFFFFSMSQHGAYLLSKAGFSGGLVMEYFIFFLHWAPLNLLIMSFFFII